MRELDDALSADLQYRARRIRRAILHSIHAVQTGHGGSSLSLVEILVALYFRHLRHDPANPLDPDRDWLVLSKGHGAPALYATLVEAAYLPLRELATLRQLGTRLQGHPNALALSGVDVCTGSLGQGLSIAGGLGLGHRLAGRPSRVYCILGDGELQEGQNWEAAMSIAAYRLGCVTAIVDRNLLQNDGATEEVLALGDLAAKWRAFGWAAETIDGHDLRALDRALCAAKSSTAIPHAIIAETVKGKGVSFMERAVEWHHKPISDEELAIALSDIGSANGAPDA